MTVMATTPQAATSIETETRGTFEYIGIEFEYPIARVPEMVPATYGQRSGNLLEEVGLGNSFYAGELGVQAGTMGRDHTGAEIRSAPMNIYSTEPEIWYRKTAAEATNMGFPFAATGSGATTFGLHFNLFPVPVEKAEALYDMVAEPWADVFFCASVDGDGADPWRHGGVSRRDLEGERSFNHPSRYMIREQNDSRADYTTRNGNYYEFRLPEPGLPNHFNLMVQFMRKLDTEGAEAAREFGRDLVYEASPLLTPVQQYQILREQDGWLDTAFDDRARNRPHAARFMGEIMGDL